MLRIAIFNENLKECVRVRDLVEGYATGQNYGSVEVNMFTNLDDMKDLVSSRRGDFYDALLCALEPSPERVLSAVEELQQGGCRASIVFASTSQEWAARAYKLDAVGYIQLPAQQGVFEGVLNRAFKRGGDKRRSGIYVKSRKATENILFDAVLFVETARNGLIIHLPAGRTVLTRGTLQSLFDRLAVDSRFAKTGSSFIVNLDNVRSFGEGTMIFGDGEAIIVPVRVRKTAQQALDDYRAGRI